MRDDMIHSGYIDSKKYKHFTYDFNNGILKVYLYDKMPELEGKNFIEVKAYNGKRYLLYTHTVRYFGLSILSSRL